MSIIESNAPIPPKLDNSFSHYSALLYVPTAFMELYQETVGWKNFNVLPIQSNRLNVSFPVKQYKGLYLELTDSNDELLSRILIDNSSSLAFYLPDEEDGVTYNVYLKNKSGAILGSIKDIVFTGENMTVTFDSLLQSQSIAVNIFTLEGKDVTAESVVTWYDANGSYLCKGATLDGQVEETEVKYSVKLPKELAMQYMQPEQTTYKVKSSDNNIMVVLEPFASTEITGVVRDSTTNIPICNAMVIFSQKLNGEHAHITRAETDSKGAFKANIYDVPTEVTVAAADYISYTLSLDTLTEAAALSEILMKPISGVVVSTGFTYRTSVVEGETPDILDWYSDYANVKYGILNKTTGLPVSNFSVQYPQIVLLDDVAVGDELLLTVVSRTGSFEPTQTTAVVDSALRCDATFDIVELGGIKASYTTTANGAVVGILYNEIGEMLQKRSYASGSLTFDNLRDGVYTLVTMGSSDYFNAIYSLSQLAAVGLVEGADYVKHAVTVESGVVSVVEMESVPTFDESKLYYTDGDTRFTVNKTSVTAGNYLTLTGKIDFKEEYASKVSNVSMVIDIPESAVFVDNSVMVGTAVVGYVMEGNRLTISLPNNYTERVRFCIIPTEGGSYAPNAFAQFSIDGKEVLQPIGSAHYTIKDLSIDVPSVSAKTTIPVNGVAIANSTVQIYDNDVLIGETTSLANGTWSTTCELHKPYNLSTHRIHAKVISKLGVEVMSEMKECMYDMNAVQVSKVTMYHNNPEMRKTYESVFDFMNPSSKPNQWIVYYPKKKFTYTVEFTNNSPEVVQNVVLYVHTADGKAVPLYPEYNEEKDLWTADIDMGNRSDSYYPVNVSVDFDCRTERVIDVSESVEITKDIISLTDDFAKGCQVISDYLNNNELDYDKLYSITDSLGIPIKISMENSDDILPVEFDSWSFEKQEEFVENELAVCMAENDQLISSLAYLDSAFTYQKEISVEFDGVYFMVKSCDDINLTGLIDNGFTENVTTTGTKVYSKITETTVICVDLANDLYIESNIIKEVAMFAKSSSGDNQSALQKYSDCMKAIKGIMDVINLKWTELQTLAQFPVEKLDEAILEIETRLVNVTNWKNNSKISVSKKMKWAIEEDRLIHALAGAKMARRICGPLIKRLLKAVPYAGYVATLNDCYHDSNQILSLYNSIPELCPDDSEKASSCRNWCFSLWGSVAALATVDVIGSFSSDAAIVGGVIGSFATAGTSLGATAAGAVTKAVIAIGGVVADSSIEWSMGELDSEISSLRCYKDCGEPGMPPCPDPNPGGDGGDDNDNGDNGTGNNNGNGGGHQSGQPNDNVQIDPSGYVYEGVSSNRLGGVTASCYYKETVEDVYGDLHENVVLWDAEEYAQENPLFTDEYGMYRWDVPKGLWQVKFEKEGYETTYSEWLPVPPPQLEVNIPMVQNKQPEVAGVHAYKDGVEIEFDKYMQPATLNTDNIYVIQNGEKVAGKVTLLNEEVAYEGKSETFASKVRFVFDQAITAKEITLTVVNGVKSYAGLQMQDTYTQTFAIEQEVEGIVADSLVSMYYGGEHTLTVKVIPAEAAAGKTLVVASSSSMILAVDTDSITLDSKGEAVVTISGELPGTGVINYSLVGYDYRASTLVEVEYNDMKMTANPTASIASGSTVKKGTEVTLNCTTEGAVIYYTLDGSCPCDDTAILYDGTPIVINENTELRIMAVAEGMYESDVVVYNYYVEGADVEEVTLPFAIDPTIVTDGFRVQGIETECTVAVYGVGGELVMQREHVKNNTFVNIAHVPEGMYIVVVSKDDDTHKQRILKVK